MLHIEVRSSTVCFTDLVKLNLLMVVQCWHRTNFCYYPGCLKVDAHNENSKNDTKIINSQHKSKYVKQTVDNPKLIKFNSRSTKRTLILAKLVLVRYWNINKQLITLIAKRTIPPIEGYFKWKQQFWKQKAAQILFQLLAIFL